MSSEETHQWPTKNDGEEPSYSLDDYLIDCLEKLSEIAPVENPSKLISLLPEEISEQHSFLLIEMIKLDMAAAAEGGVSPRIETYLAPIAVALPTVLPIERVPFDLVLEECQIRKELGEDPDPRDTAQRFPQHAELLTRFDDAATSMADDAQSVLCDELVPNSRVDDFLIVQTLGRGAFAQVYLARQESMQRLVALKVSKKSGGEPQIMAQLDHPNIARVYDQRIDEQNGSHLLYMQYLPGGTLADVVRSVRHVEPSKRTGKLILDAVDNRLLSASQLSPEHSSVRSWLKSASWPRSVAWLGVQLAQALNEAHRQGILHRDLKPANVLLSSEGIPKLADFNVSANLEEEDESSLGGSIGYMAPEHLAAFQTGPFDKRPTVSEQADIYGLSILLWELWQGFRPFDVNQDSDTFDEAVTNQLNARFEPLIEPQTSRNPGELVLEKRLRESLHPAAERRPQSGREMAGGLRLALHPEAAKIFNADACSWRQRILSVSPWLIAAMAVLLPNIAAGIFNYFYNEREIILGYQDYPNLINNFQSLAVVVNTIAFPLGGFLTIRFAKPLVTAFRAALVGEEISMAQLNNTVALCRRTALVGGALWGAASLIYPLTLLCLHPEFLPIDALHFFISLLICGGVACVYPYFSLLLLVTQVYYPRLMRRTMSDPDFDSRLATIQRDASTFLLVAGLTPLLAITLLVSTNVDAKVTVLVAVAATAIGLIASFTVYRKVLSIWEHMASVLSSERASAIPGIRTE